jgi:hypothetical protein
MNKHFRLPVDIELVHHLAQVVLRLSFRHEAVQDWCLGLCLLTEGLIETLSIRGERPKMGVEIRLTANQEIGGAALISFKSDISQIELTRANLSYVQHFFLKYYCNGVPDVDHIDLEAMNKDTGDKGLYITFKVPHSRPSVSPDEAERRLQG